MPREQVMLAGEPPRPRVILLLWIAGRDLLASRFTAALLVSAVAIGVGFQIPNSANLRGYTAELVQHGIASGFGDVRVRPGRGDRFADPAPIAARLRQVAGVEAVVPVLMLPGSVGTPARRGDAFLSLPVAGLDASTARVPYRLVRGAALPGGDEEGLLLGASAASRLGVDVGDQVSLRVVFAAPGSRLVLDDDGLGRYQMTVRGVVAGNFGAFDPVFVDRAFLSREAGAPGAASVLFAYGDGHDPFAAAAMTERIRTALPEVAAVSWIEDAPFLRASIHASTVMADLSQTMVFLAVAVPAMALLYISALGRRRQVALLAAMGFGRGELFAVALLQALMVGVAGALAGLAVGFAAVRYFAGHPVFQWHSFVVRPVFSTAVVARSTLLALAATTLAGVYPALRAALTDPARVLREID